MSNAVFEDRFEIVQRWLQRRRVHLVTAVLRVGRVHMTDAVSTAAIVANGSEVQLYFNPEFCRQIDNAQLAGVLAHEALHFFLSHQKRVARIRSQLDRSYFNLACDAVINDLIQASFPELKLPGKPITGIGLVGQDTKGLSAEQVFRLLWRDRIRGRSVLNGSLAEGQTIDDHSLWGTGPDETGPESPPAGDVPDHPETSGSPLPTGTWTDETSELVARVLAELPPDDPCWGTVAAGVNRPVSPVGPVRKDLERFLNETVSASRGYETLWTVPNRKLFAVYPRVILPTYEPRHWWDILVAIDTSGSVPSHFISVALAFSRQRIPRTQITVVSFDTVWYEPPPDGTTLKGGGGTRAQAVEEFIQQRMPVYPHHVFVLTDGWTPSPLPRHPERWIWLLPPWGSSRAVPERSVVEFFAARQLPGQSRRKRLAGPRPLSRSHRSRAMPSARCVTQPATAQSPQTITPPANCSGATEPLPTQQAITPDPTSHS